MALNRHRDQPPKSISWSGAHVLPRLAGAPLGDHGVGAAPAQLRGRHFGLRVKLTDALVERRAADDDVA